jgi:hypothetical protein
MKDNKLIIGLGVSALGIIAIIYLIRKIKQDAARAAQAMPRQEIAQAPAGEIEKNPPGLTTDESALLKAWQRSQQGEGKI